MLSFDKPRIAKALSTLSVREGILPALASSARLSPFYVAFAHRAKWGNGAALQTALDHAWGYARGEPQSRAATVYHKTIVDSLAAAEPREGFGLGYVCSHFEALAVGACLQAQVNRERKSIVAAMEWVFEATYAFARDLIFRGQGPILVTPEVDQKILEHAIVQAELSRQQRDLEDICCMRRSDIRITVELLRRRSEQELALPTPARIRGRKARRY